MRFRFKLTTLLPHDDRRNSPGLLIYGLCLEGHSKLCTVDIERNENFRTPSRSMQYEGTVTSFDIQAMDSVIAQLRTSNERGKQDLAWLMSRASLILKETKFVF